MPGCAGFAYYCSFQEQFIAPWLNIFSITLGIFVVVIFAFLAAVYMTGEPLEKEIRNTFIKYTEKEKALLEYLEQHETITMNRFCRIAQIGYKQAENILLNFIVLDIIEIIFTEKQIYYSLKQSAEKELS